MACGDPMWRCKFCGKVYYMANRELGCCECSNSDLFKTPKMVPPKKTINYPSNLAQKDQRSLNEIFEQTFNDGFDDQEMQECLNNQFDKLFPKKDTLPKRKDTLVVNFFAGPGAGKSTTAAGTFFELKTREINCELAAEYAKDLAWEERHRTFEDQIYIFGKQYHRIFRLLGQVDVIITDSPLLLSTIYDKEQRKTFRKLVIEEHKKMWTYNCFIKRKKNYNPKGRIHSEEEASNLDRQILDMLYEADECFEVFEGTPEGKDKIVSKIISFLEFQK